MGKFVMKKVPSGIKFDLKATNGEIILSSEVYKSKASCKAGIMSVIKNSVGGIDDLTVEGAKTKVKHPKFEMYTDKKGEFRFRLKATNGQIIGVSEGYKTKKSCENGIASVKKNAPDAQTVEEDAE